MRQMDWYEIAVKRSDRNKLSEAEKDSLINIFEKIDRSLKNELERLGIDDYL